MGARIDATGNVTLWVRHDGSDSNDGLANTASRAFRTYQAAINHLLNNYDMRGFAATIAVGTVGAHDPFVVWGRPVGGGTRRPLSILGFPNAPANALISSGAQHAIENWHSDLYVSGFKLETTSGVALFGNDAGFTDFGAMDFGACGNSHVLGGYNHQFCVHSDYTISGPARIHWHLKDGATLFCPEKTITLLNTPHFSDEFLGMNKATARLGGTTFIGAATGKKHVVYHQALIDPGGQPRSWLPGNVAGEVWDGTLGMPNTGGLWL